MKGPGDISQLLSGLKTKQVNIPASNMANEKDPSTVSIAELKELSDQKMPKSNRKSKSGSSKNTISLDLINLHKNPLYRIYIIYMARVLNTRIK